jgi:PTS system nitrogen regulatory IIA component
MRKIDVEVLEKLMTPNEVAKYLRLDVQTVYRWARAGIIPGVKMGFAMRFHKDDIEKFLVGKIMKKIKGK